MLKSDLVPSSLASWVEYYGLFGTETAFTENTITNIQSLLDEIGGDITSFWGYEIPLYDFPIKPDFLLCVDNPLSLHGALIDSYVTGKNSLRAKFPVYERLFTLSEYWLKQKAAGRELINNTWLEYDHMNIVSDNIIPNFFFGPSDSSSEIFIENCRTVMHIIEGKPTEKFVFDQLGRCVQSLPEGAMISQVGKMLARGDHHLRLYIQSISSGQHPIFLRNIGYQHYDNIRLNNLLDDLTNFTSSIDLDIDLHRQVGNTIGLELYFSTVQSVLDCLEYFLTKNICSNKLHQILSIHIRNIRISSEDRFHHFFSHFKVVFSPGESLRGKAYLAFVNPKYAKKLIKVGHPINE